MSEPAYRNVSVDEDPACPSHDAGPRVSYQLHIDGGVREVAGAWFGESLLRVLRDHLGVLSVKDACEQGRCGSCSVLMDGRLVTSCTVLAADAADAQVTTVAGLGVGGPARAVQAAFLAHGAVQCGFCTPGFVVAVTDLLARRPDADEDEIRESLAGNICRCTGYGRIIAAIRSVQEARRRPGDTRWRPGTGQRPGTDQRQGTGR
ncbi:MULTISPECIES: (2Fe-2S)-binding protein [Protofrankia]|uniref:(2Fe-2S)-binding protein n=1 Tax=Protofrankia coriariae TaxID=1562887 RepID=A0ABR5F342_9ACTN|nr:MULTISPECIES: (2Fe-2S)-binding protein [Protofrankia]KLL11141.1 (2Fe-2S)-binding protein [Protofrankia coriariae]ONH34767.1 (2Fe-2S)-binding protein [Protofrankia sp. BMG5.30]